MKTLTRTAVNALFQRFSDADPEPKTELIAPNPFCLLIAIVLSAQATDAGVNKATPALFAAADNPKDMQALGLDGIKHYIKTIGLFNSKAQNILTLCGQLLDNHHGEVPHTREELQALAGVGRKTANVWLNCVLGLPTMAVDTHVQRVSNRLGLCHTKTPEQTEKALEKAIPAIWMRHAHHWLILHGRYTCKARTPACYNCRVSDLCLFSEKTKAAS